MSFLSYMLACAREYKRRQTYTPPRPSDGMDLEMHERGYERATLKNGTKDTGIYIENGVETVVVRYTYISDGRHAWGGDALFRWYHRTNKRENGGVVFEYDPNEDR